MFSNMKRSPFTLLTEFEERVGGGGELNGCCWGNLRSKFWYVSFSDTLTPTINGRFDSCKNKGLYMYESYFMSGDCLKIHENLYLEEKNMCYWL